MKIELIKEHKFNQDKPYYFIEIDGKFIDSSLSFDYEKTKIMYDRLVDSKGVQNVIEIIETKEI
jgi:hypothetical protein